jgi:hypothetical protein
MGKKAVSLTLTTDNLTWLKGRSVAAGESMSELIDQIVSAARAAGRIGPTRSVAGTIDIDSSDPLLEGADAAVHALFQASLARPLMVAERRTAYRSGGKGRRTRRG